MENHVQCHLANKDSHYHCWLPEKFAKEGKWIQVELEGTWYDFQVMETFTTLPSPMVRERSQDYKKTRKASDI